MSVEIHIVQGAIGATAERSEERAGDVLSLPRIAQLEIGAELVFDGIVRRMAGGREVAALEYEVYEPMASRQLGTLGEDVTRKHGLIGLRCVHSRGRVGVGECSMRVTIWSAHRAPALVGMGEFIDRLKLDVPIWKKVVWR